MTEQEIINQKEHEARMELERKAFAAAWPVLWKGGSEIHVSIAHAPTPALHHFAWLVWRAAKGLK